MNAFVDAVNNIPVVAYTNNGAVTNESTLDPVLDYFNLAGSSRRSPQNAVNAFKQAYHANPRLALQALLWTRDVRGGAGEREVVRQIFQWMVNDPCVSEDHTKAVLRMLPEFGRWDDVLIAYGTKLWDTAVGMVWRALVDNNGLCAKWMPRKGEIAVTLRTALGMTPKQYRKTLVNLTKVVETQMCAQQWEAIDLEKVPSLAQARYKNAFKRHIPQKQTEFVAAVQKGEAKVNTAAVYPYDVMKMLSCGYASTAKDETGMAQIMWDALPNYITGGDIIPLIDVSGSMQTPVGNSTTAMDVAVSLGLYCSEKQSGAFKNMFVTFTDDAKLMTVAGSLATKLSTILSAPWGGSTNLQSAFKNILNVAVKGKVPADQMPKYLLVLSDMEFNHCGRDTNLNAARQMFESYGYKLPKVVFWNLMGRPGNAPATKRDVDVALVSGFSPSIMTAVLSSPEQYTPINVMLKAIDVPRYQRFDFLAA